MRRRRGLALIGILVAVCLAVPGVVIGAREVRQVDQCLDAGGSFDYQRIVCDRSSNHAYVSFLDRHRGLALMGIAASVLFVGSTFVLGRHRQLEA
jgi:hypothetical protein